MVAKKYIPHYTISDWEQWEGDWELIDGLPVSMSPSPVIKHQRLNGIIWNKLENALSKCTKCLVIQEIDWEITKDTVVKPDLVIVCGDRDKLLEQKRLVDTPELVVEILSESTERKDRETKYFLYEENGVPSFILVNPHNNNIEVYELKNKKYTLVYKGAGANLPHQTGDCHITVDWGEIWKY